MVSRPGLAVTVPDPTLRPLTSPTDKPNPTSPVERERLRLTALQHAQAALTLSSNPSRLSPPAGYPQQRAAAQLRQPIATRLARLTATASPSDRHDEAMTASSEQAADGGAAPTYTESATDDAGTAAAAAAAAAAANDGQVDTEAAAPAPPSTDSADSSSPPDQAGQQEEHAQPGDTAPQEQQQATDAGTPPPPPPPAPARPKQLVYTFPSPPADTADLLSELEEFYSYVEVPQVIEHYESWTSAHKDGPPFSELPQDRQHDIIDSLLTKLSAHSASSSDRHTAARHLLHIAHGTFSPELCNSPEIHLHLILTNCRALRTAGALPRLWSALKRTAREWEDLSHLPVPPDQDSQHGGDDQHPHDNQHLHPNVNRQQAGRSPSAYSANRRAIDAQQEEAKAAERQERLDEANAELALLLAVLYFMTECSRGDETWGDELMSLDPPMPVYLYNQVAGLRERNAKGYPVKKLLLLLWKSLLCTLGGMKDVARVKALVREVEGLPVDDSSDRPTYKPWTKASPPDILSFRNETLAKYPSYTPPSAGALLPLPAPLAPLADNPEMLDRISAAAAPIPVRPTFSYHINANHDPALPSNIPGPPPANWPHQPQPPTPAPSPPPTPPPIINQPTPPNGQGPPAKPKKQQFQTDQTRPFPLPFAPANAKRGRAVPRAIEEAGELYRRNLRISTELWQAWKVREEFRSDEMGWTKAAEVEREKEVYEREKKRREAIEASGVGAAAKAKLREDRRKARALGRRLEELALGDVGSDLRKKGLLESTGGEFSSSASSVKEGRGTASGVETPEDVALDSDDDDNDAEDPMDPLTVLHNLMRQLKRDIKVEPDERRRKELEERRLDVQRLERIERLYRMTLPHLQSAVIVLLKLLLATVTANQNLAGPAQNGEEPTSSEPPPDLSLEDIDILRHREITSKAVSAILILTLKWFKASHIMKFHYFSQLLVDSNCLLLILKMFGMQEVSTLVRIRHEKPDQNFFRYCQDHLHPDKAERPEDALLSQPPTGDRAPSPAHSSGTNDSSSGALVKEGAEIELVSDYSWRNFFSTINFVHILQKLTKRKTHRVLLMVQYKSSAILKRILKVSHPTLQLFVLKVIKSQVPYCGRKWRQSNMKVITAIYLHCRPDLRDEWLAGIDVDADVEESLPHEQALRSLVRFFNTQHYGQHAPGLHRRSSSVPTNPNEPSPDFNPGPVASVPLPPLSPHGPPPDHPSAIEDVFPPPRAISSIDVDAKVPLKLAYGAVESAEDLEGYEVDDLLAASGRASGQEAVTSAITAYRSALESAGGSGVATPEGTAAASGAAGSDSQVPQVSVVDHDDLLDFLNDPLGSSDAAWERLGLEGYDGEWDDVSDSESVGGWGFMRFGVDDKPGTTGTLGDDGEAVLDEQSERLEWQHISPETITALEEERAAADAASPITPNSPRPPRNRRRSSTGPISPALRPVLIDRDDDGGASDDAPNADGEEGPAPIAPHEGPAIDEVELVFNQ